MSQATCSRSPPASPLARRSGAISTGGATASKSTSTASIASITATSPAIPGSTIPSTAGACPTGTPMSRGTLPARARRSLQPSRSQQRETSRRRKGGTLAAARPHGQGPARIGRACDATLGRGRSTTSARLGAAACVVIAAVVAADDVREGGADPTGTPPSTLHVLPRRQLYWLCSGGVRFINPRYRRELLARHAPILYCATHFRLFQDFFGARSAPRVGDRAAFCAPRQRKQAMTARGKRTIHRRVCGRAGFAAGGWPQGRGGQQ